MKTSRFLTVAAMALIVSSSVFAQDDQSANRRPRPQRPQVAQQGEQPQAPQRQQPTEEEMLQRRTERMQRELMLDDATAQKFAPIYQEYLTALKALRGDEPRGPQAGGPQAGGPQANAGEQPQKQELTDAEITAKLKERIQKQRDMADLQETYLTKFAKVLNARQLAKVFAAPHHGHGPGQFGHPGHGPGHPGQGPRGGQPGQGGHPGHGQGQPGQGGQPGHGGPGAPQGAPQDGQPQDQPQAQQQ